MADQTTSGSPARTASWESTSQKDRPAASSETPTASFSTGPAAPSSTGKPVSIPRSKLLRRRKAEEAFHHVTKIVGYAALVAIFSAICYVIFDKTTHSSKFDEDYLEAMYDEEIARGPTWSGIKESQPALLAPHKDKLPGTKFPADSKTPEAENQETPSGAGALLTTAEQRASERAALGLPKLDTKVVGITNVEAKRPLIEEAVRKFFEADTLAAKLAYVRDAHRVHPLMREYYSRQPMPRPKWKSLGWTLPVDEPGYRLGYVQALFENNAPSSIIVEETENGSFLVDWESYVRYGELSWQDFLKHKPSQPKLFRVIASKAESSDISRLRYDEELIEIKHPAEEGKVLATFDKNDPNLAPIVQQLQSGNWKDVPLTLRLCYPGSAGEGAAVRIAGVEGKGWLILQHTRS